MKKIALFLMKIRYFWMTKAKVCNEFSFITKFRYFLEIYCLNCSSKLIGRFRCKSRWKYNYIRWNCFWNLYSYKHYKCKLQYCYWDWGNFFHGEWNQGRVRNVFLHNNVFRRHNDEDDVDINIFSRFRWSLQSESLLQWWGMCWVSKSWISLAGILLHLSNRTDCLYRKKLSVRTLQSKPLHKRWKMPNCRFEKIGIRKHQMQLSDWIRWKFLRTATALIAFLCLR